MNKSRTPHSCHEVSQTTPVYSGGYVIRQAGNIRSISFDGSDARQDRLHRSSAKVLDKIFGVTLASAQDSRETGLRTLVDNSPNPLSMIGTDFK